MINEPIRTTNLASSPPTNKIIEKINFTSSLIISQFRSPAILDTGCSSHYVTSDAPVTNKRHANPGVQVGLPNGNVLQSSHTATLNLHPALPLEASSAHIFPAFTTNSLISVGQLCDHGCTASFTDHTATIIYHNQTIITGTRSAVDKLWYFDLDNCSTPPPQTPVLSKLPLTCNVVNPTTTLADRITYYHAAAFSPVLSTWCEAIDNGHFTTWPELTSALVRRHPPSSLATVKGHLDQTRANQRSTKPSPAPTTHTTKGIPPVSSTATTSEEEADDLSPAITSPPAQRTHHVFAACQSVTGQIYSDPTGRFVAPSSSGNSYMLVVYDYDSNMIFAEPMKSKSGADHLAAYKQVHSLLTSRGLKPQLQRLDNEASTALQNFMHAEQIDFQLVPPHVHRRNAAERAIRTFKNHFIAGLCSTDPDFPLHLWDQLLPQALLTLNLLRRSRINPCLSAQAQVHGPFNFDRTPLGPPGTKVLVHEKPNNRETWAPHAVDGWYLGPAMNHYRCFRVWINSTQAERITDTLTWFPSKVLMSTASSSDAAIAAANDLTHALLNPSPASALSPLSDSQRHALLQLKDIFVHQTTTPTIPPGFPALTNAPVPTPDHTIIPNTAAPLKVTFNPSTAPDTAPKPRVEATQDSPHAPKPATPNHPPLTYADRTGNPGQRRRATRAKKRILATIRTTAAHNHGTRLQTNKKHQQSNKANHGLLLTLQVATSESANTVTDPLTGTTFEYTQLIKGPHKIRWFRAAAREFGRLAQGLGPDSDMLTGTDTIRFIRHTDLPADRKATYSRFVASERPNKEELYRVRLTAGGNLVDYPGPVSTPTVDMPVVKCHLNSVLSTPNGRFGVIDIKDFYLNTLMARKEYMRIPIAHIPQVIIDLYNLMPLVHNGYILVEIRKGMYGLPQAGILANTQLVKHLALHGYIPAAHTPGLFTHIDNGLSFTLCVDDFGIKYVSQASADHLENVLKMKYKITTDWTGSTYLGLTLQWDYVNRTLDISMPGYIARALSRFQHPEPTRPQHSPHEWIAPVYGAPTQLTDAPDTTESLPGAGKLFIQQVIGVLLYYARAVDNTLLVALGTLSSAQAHPTMHTHKGIVHILNYCATHPDAVVRFTASDMILHVHSDASYLSASHARSRAGGYFFLSSRLPDHTKAPTPESTPPPFNGPVLVNSSIMKSVLASASRK